jgi:hypothetical protein
VLCGDDRPIEMNTPASCNAAMRTTRGLALVFAICVLAACSGAPSQPSGSRQLQPGNSVVLPAGPVDGCSLISMTDATTVLELGEDVNRQEPGTDTRWHSCHYATATRDVFDVGYASGPEAVANFNQCRPSTYGSAIEGLGDEAFFSGDCGLLVRVGDAVLETFGRPDVFKERIGEYLIKLMRLAMSHLGWPETAPGAMAAWADSPCALITADELKAEVGIEIPYTTPGTSDALHRQGNCDYANDNGELVFETVIGIGPSHAGIFNESKNETASQDATKAPVAGIGDDAFQEVFGADTSDLDVRLNARKGDAVLELTLHNLGYDDAGNPTFAGTADQELQILARLANVSFGRLASTAPAASASSAPNQSQLCNLLDAADVSAAFGTAMIAVPATDSYERPLCDWESPPNVPREQSKYAFQIRELDPGEVDGYTPQFPTMTALPDVGVEGYLLDADYTVPTVFTKSVGGHWLQLSGNYESVNENLITFARKAVDRADEVLGAVALPTPPPVAVAVCDLLSTQEVATVLGVPITSALDNVDECDYHSLGGTTESVPLLLGFTRGPNEAESYAAQKSSAETAWEGFASVPSLGDDAYTFEYPANSGNTVTLVVLKGDAQLRLDSGEMAHSTSSGIEWQLLGTPAEQLDMLTQLASLALART